MKIAIITDDGTTVSQHFGRAPFYLVVNVEGDKITGKEKRSKMGHNEFADAPTGHEEAHPAGQPHGYDAESQTRHAGMAGAISDCQVLIAGGMGRGAYDSLTQLKIKVVMTDIRSIDEAVKLYLEGKLKNQLELTH